MCGGDNSNSWTSIIIPPPEFVNVKWLGGDGKEGSEGEREGGREREREERRDVEREGGMKKEEMWKEREG